MKAWKRIPPTRIHKVGHRTLVSKTFLMPNGEQETFDLINEESFGATAVVALTDENKVIVARQFRPGPELFMDELPGGGLKENEEPEQGIRREFLEETGYVLGKVEYLGVAHYDAYTNGKRHCFFATNCQPSELGHSHEPNEYIEINEISIAQFLKNAQAGLITDPGPILFAYEKLVKIQKEL